VTFVQFDINSPYYQQMLALRQQELRKPLGLDIYQQDLSQEDKYWHFGLLSDQQLVACVMIKPQGLSDVILKQMAVSTKQQGNGLGLTLLKLVERALVKHGVTHIKLAARQQAIGFYKKMDYKTQGDLFIDVGIMHQWMHKEILQ